MLRLISDNTTIKFIRLKTFSFSLSAALSILAILSVVFIGLNFGIDFKGGILLELRSKNLNSSNINDLRKKISTLNAGEVSIQNFGKDTDFLVRIQKQEGDQKEQIAMIEKVKFLI